MPSKWDIRKLTPWSLSEVWDWDERIQLIYPVTLLDLLEKIESLEKLILDNNLSWKHLENN